MWFFSSFLWCLFCQPRNDSRSLFFTIGYKYTALSVRLCWNVCGSVKIFDGDIILFTLLFSSIQSKQNHEFVWIGPLRRGGKSQRERERENKTMHTQSNTKQTIERTKKRAILITIYPLLFAFFCGRTLLRFIVLIWALKFVRVHEVYTRFSMYLFPYYMRNAYANQHINIYIFTNTHWVSREMSIARQCSCQLDAQLTRSHLIRQNCGCEFRCQCRFSFGLDK